MNHCTVTVTFVEVVIFALTQSVPVMVKVYLPAVVAGIEEPEELELPFPPHPIAPTAITAIRRAAIVIQRRRREGMPKTRNAARIAPPPPNLHKLVPAGPFNAVVEAAVVFTVKTVVAFLPEVTVTVIGLRLQVGRLTAPEGEPVSEQVKFSVPEYVLPAEMVPVDVPLAPGIIGAGAAKAITACATVTEAVPLAAP